MLLLSHRTDEYITIFTPDNQEITIKVINTKHGQVKLGFDAPEDFLILRDEIKD